MGVYQWKSGSRVKGDAQAIGEELASIDKLTPESVVKKARSKRSAMHECFTWDDDKAAHQWRLQEARHVVNAIVVVAEADEQIEARVYESVVINDERQYVPRDVWAYDEGLRNQVFGQINAGIAELLHKSEVYCYLDEKRFGKLQQHLNLAKEAVTA